MKKGDYVTALVTKLGYPLQGAVHKIQRNRIIIKCLDNTEYLCFKNAVIVDDKSLWGDALYFLRKYRKKHNINKGIVVGYVKRS